MHVADIFVPDSDAQGGKANIVLNNALGLTQTLKEGSEIWWRLEIDVLLQSQIVLNKD